MMVMMRKARNIPRAAPLGPWLLKVTHDLAIDSLRSESTRRRHEQLAAMERREIQSSTIPSRWHSFESILDEVLHTMGIDDRTVLTLRYLQGWPVEQIARELNLSKEATRQRLSRAVRRLRTLVARRKDREDEPLPAIPLPLMESKAAGGSLFARFLAKGNRIAKTINRFRRILAIASVVLVMAGPLIVFLVFHHRPPSNRPREGTASPHLAVP
jgi:RNA polymerase sigma factor (sigma-70 family)